MPISITVTIEERPDGNVDTRIKSCSIGTNKELVYAVAVLKAFKVATKFIAEKAGGHQEEIHSWERIVPMEGEE